MTKTLEIIVSDEHDETMYRIKTPDHEHPVFARSYTTPKAYQLFDEIDAYGTIDIPRNRYFHLNVKENHARISVGDEPQNQSVTFSLHFRQAYNFSELVAECGVPDNDQAYEVLKYLPEPEITFEYKGGDVSIKGVEIDGEEYIQKDVR